MPQRKRRHLFVSYSQRDVDVVQRVVKAVELEIKKRALPLDIWVDREMLQPGQEWKLAIEDALVNALGIIVFVSPASMQSDWVNRELAAGFGSADRLLLPIIISHVPNLPRPLAERQWLDLSGRKTEADFIRAAAEVVRAAERYLGREDVVPPVSIPDASEVSEDLARGIRAAERKPVGNAKRPDSVFVVHGHDEETLNLVCSFVRNIGIRPVVLSQEYGPAQSLLQKFLASSKEARFAIAILSGDDFGASRLQYEEDGVADKALQFRARQNVILELGFFYGHLGWENVFVLYRKPPKVFPNFERPSDLDGAVFDAIDAAGRWRLTLSKKLTEAGFKVDAAQPVVPPDGPASTASPLRQARPVNRR